MPNDHWTKNNIDDFLFRITFDYVTQLEQAMEAAGVNQNVLANVLGVSEGRVSQVLNSPGNMTLRKVVEYARALGKKVSIVAYDDNDPANENGPINAGVFTRCWERCGKPTNLFSLPEPKQVAVNAAIALLKGTYYQLDLPVTAVNLNWHIDTPNDLGTTITAPFCAHRERGVQNA